MNKILFIFGIIISMLSDAQTYQWAKAIGGTVVVNEPNVANCVVTDAAGNVYLTGNFTGTNVNFNPGGTPVLLTSGPAMDVFFAKYNTTGNCIWAKAIISSGGGRGSSIATDGLGNIYITGLYAGTAVDFDPGPGTATLSSSGGGDFYIAKFDSGGNYLWAISIGGLNNEFSRSISVDPGGNVYVTGRFQSTIIDFDPGPATSNLVLSGNTDIFIAKYNTNGNYLWARSIGGNSTNVSWSNSIANDGAGNVFITGYFQGASVDFDPGPGTATLISSGNDIYFAKYDSNGNYQWVKSVYGSSPGLGMSISADAAGNLYLTGNFQGNAVDFDAGPATATLNAGSGLAMFLAKYDFNGNYLWAKSVQNVTGVAVGKNISGQVYVTGVVNSPADFDPGPGTATLSGTQDVYFAKYDAAGNYIWAKTIVANNTLNDYPRSITVDGSDNVYISGSFVGTVVDFDPGPGSATLTTTGTIDNMYIAKYSHCGAQYVSQKSACTSTGYSINGHLYTSNGNYTDTLYTDYGCDSIVVTQLTLSAQMPTVTISSNSVLCEGAGNTITAAGAVSYSWSTGAQTTSITVTPITVMQYVVSGTGTNGCTSGATINVLPSPTISILGSQMVCKGTKAILTASVANTYTWSTGAHASTIAVTPTSSTIYTVTASITNSLCPARQTFTVGISECVGLNYGPTAPIQPTLYPNPAKSELFYNVNINGTHQYLILDNMGVVLEKGEQRGSKVRLDISPYPSGTYYLTIISRKTSKSTRFIIE